MIIFHGRYHFGLRRIGARKDFCNACERESLTELWRSFDCGHIFWIPLLPLGSRERWLCTLCHKDPHARYKTGRLVKIAGLLATAVFLAAMFAVEPKPDEVGFMWGARVFFALAFLGLLYSVIKRKTTVIEDERRSTRRPTIPPMQNYASRIQQFVEQVGDLLQPASCASLDQLTRLRLPEAVTEFYRRFEPSRTLCNGQDIRIHTIAEIVEANSKYTGLYTAPNGYVVFATNGCGDAYAYDSNVVNAEGQPRIVLFSHEWVSQELPAEDLAKLAKPVAANLGEFLDQFLKDEVDEECIYDID